MPGNTKQIKRPQRIFRKNAIPMGNLIADTLNRHGIAPQVQAAMIVREGNRTLDQIVDPDFRADMRVLSYAHQTLSIVCRHAAAAHLMNGLRVKLKELIETHIPDATVNDVFIRIDPHALDHSADTLI